MPDKSPLHDRLDFLVRALLLSLLGLTPALPLQVQDHTFVELSREVASSPETLETEAISVAKEKQYELGTTRIGDPLMLVAGSVHLLIADTPFTLYLRSTNHHTDAHLESQKLEVSKRVKQEAKAFLREVVARSTSEQG